MKTANIRSHLWNRRWTFVKVTVGLGVIVLVTSRVDWSEFWSLVTSAHPAWLVVTVLLAVLDRIFMAAKWEYLLRRMRVKISLLSAVGHYLIGSLVGIAVQWQLGGDVARATRASRDTGERDVTIGSVVIEKFVGLTSLTFLAVIALLLLNQHLRFISSNFLVPISMVSAPVVVALPFVLTSQRFTDAFATICRRLPFEQIKRFANRVSALRNAFDDIDAAIATFSGLTLVEQLVPPIGLVLLSHAYGEGISLITALSVMPLVSLLSRLPVSVESIGVKEGLYVFFLGLVGFSATQAFALAITARVIDISVVLGGTLVVEWLQRNINVRDAARNRY